MIGQNLSPVLTEIENTLLEHETTVYTQPEYTEEGFRAATKIFMSAVMDKMWDLQKKENIDVGASLAMAKKCGNELRNLVKVYTGIDTWELYKK